MTQPKRKRAKPKRRGRPPELTQPRGTKEVDGRQVEQTVADRLVEAAAVGTSHRLAAQYAGVSRSGLLAWLQKGRDALANAQERATDAQQPMSLVPKADRLYVDFMDRYEKARADAAVGSLAVIHVAAKQGTWQAAAWFLERTHPEQYARRTQTDVGAVGRDGERVSLADLFKELPEEAKE